MQIIFMRHGEAEGFKLNDKDRQLTEFGKQQAAETAENILKKYTPDVFIVSSYKRAQQTLDAFVNLAPDAARHTLNHITPMSLASAGIDEISELIESNYPKADCVLVVCHMPIVAFMVSALTSDNPTSYLFAEARVVECEHILEYLGTQIDCYVPKQP